MSSKVTAKAVSQVQNQLPSCIGEEFPLYQKFMEFYYEFMETLCVYYSGFDTDQLPAIKLEDSIDGIHHQNHLSMKLSQSSRIVQNALLQWVISK